MSHESVLNKELEQFLKYLIHKESIDSLVDCTYGAGNHSNISLSLGLETFGYDQDPFVEPLQNKLFHFRQMNFCEIEQYAHVWIADLGMSDMQLKSHRGFSFMTGDKDPKKDILDMRMDPEKGKPLKDIINYMPKYQIVDIIKNLGEEKTAKKIASSIELYRIKQKIKTTEQFVHAIGTDDYSILARVFQAFRIYINDELNVLHKLLNNIDKYAVKAACIITFHSLEDRIVKNHWKKYKGSYVMDSSHKKARSAKLRYMIKNSEHRNNIFS